MTRRRILSRRRALALAVAAGLPGLGHAESAPKPFGATPSRRQRAWQALEANAFVHFGLNTFTGREWGRGDEPPSLFNPTAFDADQIVATAKAAGLRGLVLTAKHHDGFCLWPSAHTEHSIKNSPYKNGKGDIVAELSEACRRQGLKFGVYLSPWDRHHAEYGRAAYITYYRNQLRELLTLYGPIFEVWFDGANGGEGYYGGARKTRKITADYYQWPSIIAMVRALQPMAVTFDPMGSDIRWVGNEQGRAGDPCWSTMDNRPYSEATGQSGVRGGEKWWPAEVDVSIRPGWFWRPEEDSQVRSPRDLMEIYYRSVGRGAVLLLNLPPDIHGRIPPQDAAAVVAWGKAVRDMQALNLAAGARASASSVRGRAYAASKVLDGRPDSYWACDDNVQAPRLTLDLPGPVTFDVVRLREHLPLGLRMTTFAIKVLGADGRWREVLRKSGIGAQRVLRLDAPVTTKSVRLVIVDAPQGPAITELSLFRDTL